jgi:hypothetical protein
MSRTQWVLGGILAVQVLLLIIAAPWSNEAGLESAHALLPELESFTPARLEIQETDDRSVTLERGDDGWVLADETGFPADGSKVEELLDNLEAIEVRRPVVTQSRYHDTFKVATDDYERRLRIWKDADEDPEVELFVGTSSNYRVSNVRVEGDDRVYEARDLGVYDLRTDPTSWIRRAFVDVPADDITRLVVSNGHGRFEIAREDDRWKVVEPAGASDRELDGAAVDALVRSIASLRLSEPAGAADSPAYGLDDPAATVEIAHRTAGETAEEVLEVRVGAEVEGEEGKRYASRSGSDHAVILGKLDAEKLTGEKLADLQGASDEEGV